MGERRHFSALAAIAIIAFLCTFALSLWPAISSSAPPNKASLKNGSPLHNAAWAVLVGDAEKSARVAARWDRRDEYLNSLETLRKAGAAETAVQVAGETAVGPAERAVQNAMSRDATLNQAGGKPSDGMSGRSAELYRKALRLDPQFHCDDPMKLNALGYFLAERGKTKEEFQTAEKLTRRAVKLWGEVLGQMGKDNPRRVIYEYYRAQLARDSLAWSLFQQGRYDEAEREQTEAITTTRRVSAKLGVPVQADLYYHLGEIYRKQDRFDDARKQYRLALEVDKKHEPSWRALESLGDAHEDEAAPPEEIPDEDEPDDETEVPEKSPIIPAKFGAPIQNPKTKI